MTNTNISSSYNQSAVTHDRKLYPANISAYLKELPQWVLWRLEIRNGSSKPTKMPYQINGQLAKSNDASTWTDFTSCMKVLASDRYNGFGFCFKKGDRLTGIDLDHCFDINGNLDQWAQDIIDQFDRTYIEYSPSDDGLHLWCFGLPVRTGSKKWKKPDADIDQGIEVYNYTSPRYLTVTGNIATESQQDIIDCQPGLDWLYQQYWVEPHEVPQQARNAQGQVNVELVREALTHIPSDDYAIWIDVGLACKAGGIPFEIYNEWSRKSPEYEMKDCEEKWASFNPTRIGLGSIFHYAKRYGFQFSKQFKSSSTQTSTNTSGLNDAPYIVPIWPQLDEAAFDGLVGEFITKATENSEADKAAVLFNLLPYLGCVIGSGTYVEIGDDNHPTRLDMLTIGATGRGRKGTAAAPVKKLAKLLPPDLSVRITPGPLSSGEGLIYSVRDASDKRDRYGDLIDLGVDDKRLFVLSSEFASDLAAMKRDGNTLATTLRAAWDDGDLDPLTKTNPIRATGAHICLASHITREELLKRLEDTEIFSGTMNRIIIGCVRRSKQVSNPKPLDATWLKTFAEKLSKRLAKAQKCGAVQMTDEVEEVWNAVYPKLTEDESGIVGALTSRSEAVAKRIALLYAVLDEWRERPVIDVIHLRAALAIIEFWRESVRFIYGTGTTNGERDRLCNRILKIIAGAPGGIAQTELQNALHRNFDASKLWNALQHLQVVGKLTQMKIKTEGRSKTVWVLTSGFTLDIDELNENDEETN